MYANRHFSGLQKLLSERAKLFVPHQLTRRPETVARFDSYRALRRALQDGRPRAKFILKLGSSGGRRVIETKNSTELTDDASVAFWGATIVVAPAAALILPLVAIWLFGGYENFEWVDQPITFMQGLGIMVPMFFPFGVFFYAQSRWNMARARASRRWPTVPAVVQADEVEQRQSSFFVFYKLALHYRYEVGGTSYEGDRVQFGPARVTARELIETLAAKYPPGAQVDIHYDPNDPSTAVLETSDEMAQQNGWRIGFFLAGPFLLSGVVAIRNALP
jgi:hypothetical protein